MSVGLSQHSQRYAFSSVTATWYTFLFCGLLQNWCITMTRLETFKNSTRKPKFSDLLKLKQHFPSDFFAYYYDSYACSFLLMKEIDPLCIAKSMETFLLMNNVLVYGQRLKVKWSTLNYWVLNGKDVVEGPGPPFLSTFNIKIG